MLIFSPDLAFTYVRLIGGGGRTVNKRRDSTTRSLDAKRIEGAVAILMDTVPQ